MTVSAMRPLTMLLLLLALPAVAQTPPHLRTPPPDHMRPFTRWSELIGAAVACGQRNARWAEQVRGRLHQSITASHRESLDVEQTIELGAAMEAYARTRARANRQEYCAWVINPSDLAEADAVARAERDIPPVRPPRMLPMPNGRT